METALEDYIKTIASFHTVREGKGYLVFMSGERRMRVALDRITHVSSTDEGTTIHSVAKQYPTGYHLNDIAKELPPHLFFRIHPLHIVALQHVKGIDGKEVMIGTERLFTTHYYREQFREALELKGKKTGREYR